MTAPSGQSPPDAPETFSAPDEKWMGAALERGARGVPSPNPHVGAVLVNGGQLVGGGHHERAGEEHAEIAACDNAAHVTRACRGDASLRGDAWRTRA
ncbi:MAG: hypothetical protein ACRENE_30270, partial [Polyangiaceae bacterium]